MGAIQLSEKEYRERVFELEAVIEEMDQVELPIQHDFCDGIYARTMVIPAGTILTGAIHSQEGFFVLRSGTLVITTPNGPIMMGAGEMIKTSPGAKRAGVAITNVVVTEFLKNEENAMDEQFLWDMNVVEPTADELAVKGEMKAKIERAMQWSLDYQQPQ